MNEIIVLNRESWLQAAVQKLRPIFKGHNFDVPELQVSCGWPSSGGLGKAKRTLGQCWFGESTADNKPQLFISPMLEEIITSDGKSNARGVLATLVHEVVHVIAGPDAKHGPKFVRVMKKLGLEGNPTTTHAGDDLVVRLGQIITDLGAFPHSKIVPTEKDPKKQTTRMKKCECADCSYVARTVKKWLDLYGPPLCPCNKKPMKLEGAIGEEGEGE